MPCCTSGKRVSPSASNAEPDANILELSDRLEEVVNWLNTEKLAPANIYLDWVYDQRPYIRGAISLVRKNIMLGGALAIIVLLIFLRSITSTIIVATAIPISIIGTFIFMNLLGRNLNIVSLAGIAFAVGMLIDSAIVVLENIDRHRKMGKTAFNSAYDGTREVWGAILASTLTTIAVFLPVVFMKDEAGQLFRDIAIAVTSAVGLSLFVSVSVIPMLSKQLFMLARRKRVRPSKIMAGFFRHPDSKRYDVAGKTGYPKLDDTNGNGALFQSRFHHRGRALCFPKWNIFPRETAT